MQLKVNAPDFFLFYSFPTQDLESYIIPQMLMRILHSPFSSVAHLKYSNMLWISPSSPLGPKWDKKVCNLELQTLNTSQKILEL